MDQLLLLPCLRVLDCSWWGPALPEPWALGSASMAAGEGSRAARLEAALSFGRDTALFTAGAGDRDKTLSCSCPAPKSKNFVSRGAEHSAALRVPFRLGVF